MFPGFWKPRAWRSFVCLMRIFYQKKKKEKKRNKQTNHLTILINIKFIQIVIEESIYRRGRVELENSAEFGICLHSLGCFDTDFRRPYWCFSIALKVILSSSDRHKIFTRDKLWIEVCKIDISMTTIYKKLRRLLNIIFRSMAILVYFLSCDP